MSDFAAKFKLDAATEFSTPNQSLTLLPLILAIQPLTLIDGGRNIGPVILILYCVKYGLP